MILKIHNNIFSGTKRKAPKQILKFLNKQSSRDNKFWLRLDDFKWWFKVSKAYYWIGWYAGTNFFNKRGKDITKKWVWKIN